MGTEYSEDQIEVACEWSDYRAYHGVSADELIREREYRAFLAGWEAGRYGQQRGVLR